GFLQDLLFALEDKTGGFLPPEPRVDYPKSTVTFGAFLRELARHWQYARRFAVRIEPARLTNPHPGVRSALARWLAEESGGAIRDDGHAHISDDQFWLLYLKARQLDQALALIAEAVETVPVFDNDLRPAVVVAVQQREGWRVLYPPNFAGAFGL